MSKISKETVITQVFFIIISFLSSQLVLYIIFIYYIIWSEAGSEEEEIEEVRRGEARRGEARWGKVDEEEEWEEKCTDVSTSRSKTNRTECTTWNTQKKEIKI